MEAYLAPTQPTKVNKITTSCEIYSGPHDTQYCMEDPEQAFVKYASSRIDEAGDARLSKIEAEFKQQQSEMTNKINTVLKVITDQMASTLPSDTIKNPKLRTHPVLSARSYPTEDPLGNISSNSHPQPDRLASIAIEQVRKLNSMLKSLGLVPQSSNTRFVCTKEESGEVMFIEILRDNDEPQNESPNEGEGTTTEGPAEEYFDTFLTRDKLTYHKMMYNWIMRRKLNPRENVNGGISNFTRRIKGMHVFIGNFTYVVDFMIVEDISSIIDPRLSQIEWYNSLLNLEKEHTKSVYLRNEEDKRRGVDYVMSKILRFYKKCLELGPEYVTGLDDEGEVTYGSVTSSLATRLVNKEKRFLGGNPIYFSRN
ncbi:hypothetical protein Tco_0861501 [Tanacetum coccineum]|uniref:MAK10-like protein n=1 Tax=Tanacetum coccineum TaxID=301880 RepID=A0ABQ5BM45_9ASTR